MEDFQEELNELRKIIGGKRAIIDTSGILLFKDFLSRMEEWNKAVGFNKNWLTLICYQHDLLNVVNVIAPDLLKNVISLNDFRKSDFQKDDTFNLHGARSLDAGLIHALFCWDLFKDNPLFDKFKNLPNPYDPIKALFIRGHYVDKSDPRTITIDSILSVKKQIDFRLPSLDPKFLNYLDKNCKRSGSHGVPNQEKTNELWEIFKSNNSII